MYRNLPGKGLWVVVSVLACCFFFGHSSVLASGAPAGFGEEQLLKYECVFEAKGVPRDLVVPWLLTPVESKLPGILVADPSLRRTLEQTGVDLRVLGRYEEMNSYYLVRVSPNGGESALSGMGQVLWSNGNTYLLAADGILRGRDPVPGMLIKQLRPVERSLSSMTPRTSPRVAAPVSYSETEDLLIDGMLERVSEDRILTDLERLTGEEEVLLSGGLSRINTRYSYHPDCLKAAEYIYSQFDSMGLDVAYDYYPGTILSALTFVGLEGYAGGPKGTIYHTSDGGDTWERQDSGTFMSLSGVSFAAPDTGWMCGEAGTVIRTLDGGATWAVQTDFVLLPLSPGDGARGNSSWLQSIDFANSQTGWVCGEDGVICATTDGGVHWKQQKSGTKELLTSIDFVDTQYGWAVGQLGTILHTSDGGKRWALQAGNTAVNLRAVCFVDSMHGWTVGASGVVLHTDDGGANWVAQSSGVTTYLLSIAFVDDLHGWATGGAGTVISTTDGGATWDVAQIPAVMLYNIRGLCFIDTLRGWAATSAGVVRTEDGGESWELHVIESLYWRNVVATLPGVENPSEEYIVCAHYDDTSEEPMVDAPGADDNGTGTALVLEAARILKDYRLGSTVKFVCFSGEEQYLNGSTHYVTEAILAGENIAGVLNFDMVGYGTPSIYLYTDYVSEWLVDNCVSAGNSFVPLLGLEKIIDPLWLFSDHVSFWNEGYSALTGIEVDCDASRYYHTTSDTVGTLTLSFTTDVARLAVASLATLAGLDTTATILPAATVEEKISLGSGYPNPLNPSTSISFSLPATNRVLSYSLAILDPAGRVMRVLETGYTRSTPLQRQVMWDGKNNGGRQVASGVYFSYLTCGDQKTARKLILIR